MVASKKVSGHGRDQALNLLSKNVPRKIRKERDNSRTLFTIDHGEPQGCVCVAFICTGSTFAAVVSCKYVFGLQV